MVVPSCGGNGAPQGAGRDSLQGGGGGAAPGPAHQGVAHGTKKSRRGWAR